LVAQNQSHRKGFTLIELLIVVAIIAILAAIAIPNFLAAQIRAKVSRVKSNMQTATTAIEAYYVDNNSYPASFVGDVPSLSYEYGLPIVVTTPIAYMTSIPDDIFNAFNGLGAGFAPIGYRAPGEALSGNYFNSAPSSAIIVSLYMDDPGDPGDRSADVFTDEDNTDIENVRYIVYSLGPGVLLAQDAQTNDSGFWDENSGAISTEAHAPGPYRMWYDPTNGTISIGEVVRLSSGTVSP
jgi:prepilin-type N-terminal cleavage/methylation domain-containing protein